MRGREIIGPQQIFDVDLRFHAIGQLIEERTVDPSIAREGDQIRIHGCRKCANESSDAHVDKLKIEFLIKN